jgi:clan AA aspartic protease
MITGSVNARREAVVLLRINGPGGQSLEYDAIIDTGFNGWLALPTQVVSALQLPRVGVVPALFGDGNEAVLDTHEAVILWDGQEQSVEVDCIASDALLGTARLAGFELRISFTTQGTVEISRLP